MVTFYDQAVSNDAEHQRLTKVHAYLQNVANILHDIKGSPWYQKAGTHGVLAMTLRLDQIQEHLEAVDTKLMQRQAQIRHELERAKVQEAARTIDLFVKRELEAKGLKPPEGYTQADLEPVPALNFFESEILNLLDKIMYEDENEE